MVWTRRLDLSGVMVCVLAVVVPAGPAAGAGGRAQATWRPALGPYVRYDAYRAATVCWETDEPTASVLAYGLAGRPGRRVSDPRPKRVHRLVPKDLRPGREYSYRIIGLAAANGRLFVSTDAGRIYCFAAD